jgi:hypothetical protein
MDQFVAVTKGGRVGVDLELLLDVDRLELGRNMRLVLEVFFIRVVKDLGFLDDFLERRGSRLDIFKIGKINLVSIKCMLKAYLSIF